MGTMAKTINVDEYWWRSKSSLYNITVQLACTAAASYTRCSLPKDWLGGSSVID